MKVIVLRAVRCPWKNSAILCSSLSFFQMKKLKVAEQMVALTQLAYQILI